MSSKRIDIGHDHQIEFTQWDPDLKLNPQYKPIKHLLPVKKQGCIIYHKKPNGEPCHGAITFDTEAMRFQKKVFQEKFGREDKQPMWQVASLDPLTIAPSVLCLTPDCGDHGFIQHGKWVPA